MEWYYAEGGRRAGPVDDFEFESLVETGVITAGTHVWNETLERWTPYGEIAPQRATQPQTQPQNESSGINFSQEFGTCGECGKRFPLDEMIRFQNTRVCAGCKPYFIQKLKEGANVSTDMAYAGFWIRFAAKFIDGIIANVLGGVFGGIMGILIFSVFGAGDKSGEVFQGIFQLVGLLLGVAYYIFFVGKYGATPGKMMLNLKIVRSDGSAMDYGRATGRFFAEWLSALLLSIGYIIAAFDEEKRTLHDRICDTRVILTKRSDSVD